MRSPEAFLPEVDLVNHVKMKGKRIIAPIHSSIRDAFSLGLTSIDDNEVRLSKSTCFGYLTKIGGHISYHDDDDVGNCIIPF